MLRGASFPLLSRSQEDSVASRHQELLLESSGESVLSRQPGNGLGGWHSMGTVPGSLPEV